jgi:hypothetical protein
MGYRKEDFFLDLKIKDCDSLDLFLARIKHFTDKSEICADQACMMALAIIKASTGLFDRGFLDVLCDSVGKMRDSEVFIVERRLSENEIVQAGFLPEGCTISFKNIYVQ